MVLVFLMLYSKLVRNKLLVVLVILGPFCINGRSFVTVLLMTMVHDIITFYSPSKNQQSYTVTLNRLMDM